MKHRYQTSLLLLSLIFAFAVSARAQITYQRYLDSTYAWYEAQDIFLYSGCYFSHSFIIREYYHVIGVDSVDGYFWYKVHYDMREDSECDGVVNISPVIPNNGPIFRIREDSTGKIWLREDDGTPWMMYDFRPGLNVGDTLWMLNYTDSIEIGFIDSVVLGAEKRARYWATCSQSMDPRYVVEGIGNIRGFWRWEPLCEIAWDIYPRIHCVKKDGATLVLDNRFTCGIPGHVVVGLEDEIETYLNVRWDADEERLLVDNLENIEFGPWAVFDLNGRMVAKGGQLPEAIHLPGLSTGMYVLRVSDVEGQRAVARRFMR